MIVRIHARIKYCTAVFKINIGLVVYTLDLKEIPHTECQGPCMIVYEVAVPWTLARVCIYY